MPRLQDTTKRIPFRYSTYQIRKDLVNNKIYIISFGESLGTDRVVYLINEDLNFTTFHPYEGNDLPENILLETGEDLYHCFNILYDLIKDEEKNKLNPIVKLKQGRKFGKYIAFENKDKQDMLRADGKFLLQEDIQKYAKDKILLEGTFMKVLNSKEFFDKFAKLGYFID